MPLLSQPVPHPPLWKVPAKVLPQVTVPIDSSSKINDRFKFKKDKKTSIPITRELGKRCTLSANIISVSPVSSAVPDTLSQRDPVGPSLSSPTKLPRTTPVRSNVSTSTSQSSIVPRPWSPPHPSVSPPTEVPRLHRAFVSSP